MPSLTSSSDGIEGGQYLRRISNEREVLFQNEEEAELAYWKNCINDSQGAVGSFRLVNSLTAKPRVPMTLDTQPLGPAPRVR